MVFLQNVPARIVSWPDNPVKVRRPEGGIGPSWDNGAGDGPDNDNDDHDHFDIEAFLVAVFLPSQWDQVGPAVRADAALQKRPKQVPGAHI